MRGVAEDVIKLTGVLLVPASIMFASMFYYASEEPYEKRIEVPTEVRMVDGSTRCITWLLPENHKGVWVYTSKGSYTLKYYQPTRGGDNRHRTLKNGVIDFQYVPSCK